MTKLSYTALNEQAYQILKESILHKDLPPGTRLVDSQLAEQYGISRTPMRDAIRKLVEEGLVVKNSQKGYSVYSPTIDDIKEIFELREILDIAAATKLIKEILPSHPELIAELKAGYKQICTESSDFVKDDEQLHETLIRLCGNSRIMSLYSDLDTQTRTFRRSTATNSARVKMANKMHCLIYEGVIELDLAKAVNAIKLHISYSKADAIDDFSKAE